MHLCYEPDYRFNDKYHVENFLRYMFVAAKTKMEQHSTDEVHYLVFDKGLECHYTKGTEGLEERKVVYEKVRKKFNRKGHFPKSFIVHLTEISEHEEETLESCIERLFHHLSMAGCKSDNITNFQFTTHLAQYVEGSEDLRCPHVHILYESLQDIPDEFQKLFFKEMENLNK